MYVQCLGHEINLIIQDAVKDCDELSSTLEVLRTTVTFIKASPKRKNSFESFITLENFKLDFVHSAQPVGLLDMKQFPGFWNIMKKS